MALTHYRGKLPKGFLDTGGPKDEDRITHRIAIPSGREIDGKVKKWLKIASDLDK
jgi:hypothetical protein